MKWVIASLAPSLAGVRHTGSRAGLCAPLLLSLALVSVVGPPSSAHADTIAIELTAGYLDLMDTGGHLEGTLAMFGTDGFSMVGDAHGSAFSDATRRCLDGGAACVPGFSLPMPQFIPEFFNDPEPDVGVLITFNGDSYPAGDAHGPYLNMAIAGSWLLPAFGGNEGAVVVQAPFALHAWVGGAEQAHIPGLFGGDDADIFGTGTATLWLARLGDTWQFERMRFAVPEPASLLLLGTGLLGLGFRKRRR